MSEVEKFIDQLRGLQYIVINDCYGGFSLSERAILEYKKLAGITDPSFYDRDIPRDDPYLIKIVKELGMSANGSCANLKIVEVPAGVKWIVQEYDGAEWVAEEHRTWT
jgi:DNA primase